MSGERALPHMERPELKAELENFQERMRAVMKANLGDAGLEETRLPNGAVKVDLKGRFRSPLMAVSTPDRAVVITHDFSSIQDSH